MKIKKITKKVVEKMVKLSNLTIENKEIEYFTRQFNETLEIVDKLNNLDTDGVEGTSQVTGLINVFRKDIVEKNRMFSQKEALSNSKNTYKGYFLVKAIFNDK